MTNVNQIYKCNICGNITEVLHAGMGELVCCGQPMQLMQANTEDAATEKHVPVVEKTATGVRVNIGEVDHPMEETHYIEWIEVIADGTVLRKNLQPNDKPTAEFELKSDKIEVRAYCNLHGLWKA